MNKKQLLDYESPTTQLINLRIESGILTGSIDAQSNAMPSFIEDAEEDW